MRQAISSEKMETIRKNQMKMLKTKDSTLEKTFSGYNSTINIAIEIIRELENRAIEIIQTKIQMFKRDSENTTKN